MDKLPLELKQHICSFLHASPKLPKPIRLVSKEFASAAAPFLLPRIFLFLHPDSCNEVKEIIEHPVFSKYVTTIVVDINKLKHHNEVENWIDAHDELLEDYPQWLDYKPEIDYDEDGDPILSSASSRTAWIHATKCFNKALQDTAKFFQEEYQEFWTAQNDLLRDDQSNKNFQSVFWSTVADAFKMCPSLSNLVIAPPHNHERMKHKRNHVFRAICAVQTSFVPPKWQNPPEFGLQEILRATSNHEAGLNSLTIVDFPIKCPKHLPNNSLLSVESLKHIRIGYNRLDYNPVTFDFDLRQVLDTAQALETFWMEMPPRRHDKYNANGILEAIKSKSFRHLLLNNTVVSEDSMVSFLLRYADLLQRLDLGMHLSSGTWFSTFQQISKQMKVLNRIQLAVITEVHASEEVILSVAWCRKARDFIFNGGDLAEPTASDMVDDLDDLEEGDVCLGKNDPPENGLWKDYDANANVIF